MFKLFLTLLFSSLSFSVTFVSRARFFLLGLSFGLSSAVVCPSPRVLRPLLGLSTLSRQRRHTCAAPRPLYVGNGHAYLFLDIFGRPRDIHPVSKPRISNEVPFPLPRRGLAPFWSPGPGIPSVTVRFFTNLPAASHACREFRCSGGGCFCVRVNILVSGPSGSEMERFWP